MMADNISQDEIDSKLMELSRPVENFVIEELKAILPGLGIQKQRIAEQKVLNKLFCCVQKAEIPDLREAVTCFCQIVNLLGWSDLTSLEKYALSGYDVRTKYPLVDCRLVVHKFVSNLNDIDIDILRTYICRKCNLASDRYKTGPSLVEVIFDEGVIKDQNDITKMHHIGCYFNRTSLFDEYCERHKIPKPDDLCVVSTEHNMKLLEEIIQSKTSHPSSNTMSSTCRIKAPEQVSGQQELSGDTRYTTTPNPAGETDKQIGTYEIQGVNRLSLSPGPDVPSKPIISDDGNGLLSGEVEGDRPKKIEYSISIDSDDSLRKEKERGKDADGILESDSEAELLETKGDEKSNEKEETKVTTVDSTAKRNAKICTSICSLLCVLAVFFGLAVTVFLILLAIELSKISQSQNGSVNVTDSSLVALNPDGFEGDLNNVRLTLETENDRTEVEVFKQPCDEVSISSYSLTVKKMHELVSEYFNRQAYNYNGKDKPIYGVEGSILYFTLLSSNANPSFCPRLSVFNNNILYQDAINVHVNVEGDIAQSPCFPVNTSDIPAVGTWSYTFENSEYIYVTIEKGEGVVVNGMISGTIKQYEKIPNLVEGCSDSYPLTYESRTCKVDICKKECVTYDPPKQCIFLQSNTDNNIRIQYEDMSATFTFKIMIYLTGMIFVLLLGVIPVIVLCYKHLYLPCCGQCCVKDNSSRYKLMDDVASFPSVGSQTSLRSVISAFFKNRNLSKDRKLCLLFIVVLVIILVLLIPVVIVFGIFKGNIYAPPSKSVNYIGLNTTVKIDCYDPFYVEEITIVKGSNDDYSTLFYKTPQSGFKYSSHMLKTVSRSYKEENITRNIGINYYHDNPVYVASHGNLSYEIHARNLSELSRCHLQFYLLDKEDDFENFKEKGLVQSATAISGCLYVNETNQNFTVNFLLYTSGFYYVGVSITEHVLINVTIGGTLVEFNTSDLAVEDSCSLNGYYDECSIKITESMVAPTQEHLCILAKSQIPDYHNVTVYLQYVEFNSIAFGTMCALILLILMCGCIVSYWLSLIVGNGTGCKCLLSLRKRKRNSEEEPLLDGECTTEEEIISDSRTAVHEEDISSTQCSVESDSSSCPLIPENGTNYQTRKLHNGSNTNISLDTPVQESRKSQPKYDWKLTHVVEVSVKDTEHLNSGSMRVEDFDTRETVNASKFQNNIFVDDLSESNTTKDVSNKEQVEIVFPEYNDKSSEYCTPWSDEGPFDEMLEMSFDESGLFYHSYKYGVTIIIPPGAVLKPCTLQFGACLLLPHFTSSDSFIPISPFVWIHIDSLLAKPAELYIPHYVDVSSEEDKTKLCLISTKENSQIFTAHKLARVTFSPTLARIVNYHFCSLCVAAKISPRKMYCLIYAEKELGDGSLHVDICIMYSIKCLKIVKEQFKEYIVFHLDSVSFSDGSNGMSVTFDSTPGWNINFRGISHTKITEDMIDFYKFLGCTPDTLTDDDVETLKIYEEEKSYPPRFRFLFSPDGPQSENTQVKLYLHGLNNVSPITVRLDKEKSGLCTSPVSSTSLSSDTSGYYSGAVTSTTFHHDPVTSTNGSDTFIIDLMKFLESKLQSNWYRFGHHLRIPIEELHKIEVRVGQDNERCTIQVLFMWRRLNPAASWEPIAEALKQSGLSLLSAVVTKRYMNPGPTFCQICQCTHGLDYPDIDIHDVLTSIPNSSTLLHSRPDISMLNNLISGVIPSKWELFGVQLGLDQDYLDCLHDQFHDPRNRFTHLFDEWRKRKPSEFTWSTVIRILCSRIINEFTVAENVFKQL